jgi:DNA-binding NarL/FixJ family response regulator
MLIDNNTPPKTTDFREGDLDKITNRELQILYEASEDLSNKEIADHLGIAESTVKRHRKNIYKKFEISDHKGVKKLLRWFSNLKKDK